MKSNDPGGLSEYSEIVAQTNSFEPVDTYNSSAKISGLSKSLSFIISIVLHLTCLAQYEETGLYTPDSSIVIEKVYLQTDRDYYTQGDDIWFKAYLVEDPDLSLSYNSMNLHVELISSRSEIIYSRIIRIEGGLGKGDIRLSDTLSPGVYIIRAYTSYMRNFADMQIFEKALIIFSSIDREAVKSDSVIRPSVNYTVNFFPEGGSLVNNVTCSILFKAVDETGKGCDVSGEVYASSGEPVALIRTTYKGMGRFYMRPVDGLSYYALINTPDGKSIRKDLPQSFTNGLTLNVSDYKENGPLITLRTNPATLESLTDQVHFITVSAHKRVVSTLGFSINNSLSTSFRLPLDDLPDGIIQLTLINSDGLPLCERLIFNSKETLKLEVTTDKSIYKKREKVSVKLALRSDSVINDNTFLSMSAVETSFLINNRWSNPTISSWFLLESDIRGPVEDPAYYFDPDNADRIKNLDLLLCVQGWRDFKWKYENQVFSPEYGITISGRVTKLITENPLQNAVVTAILRKEKNELMLTSATDSTGLFSFDEVDFTGDARLIATAVSEKDSPAGHLIIDTTGYTPEVVNKKSTSVFLLTGDLISEEEQSETEHEFIIRKSKDIKLMLSDTIQLGEVKIVARRNIAAPDYQTQTAYAVQRVAPGIPDVTIKITPKDERFTNFRDIIRKGVSGVRVETTNDVSESGIRIRGSSLEPLFMLDGITVPYDMVATIPIKWIDRIEVLKSGGIATSFSQTGAKDKSLETEPKFNGVISIITKPEERREEKMSVYHSVNRIVKGYDVPRIFYSPDYTSASTPYMPDMRSTLFWNPDVTLIDNETIEYYNADNKGNVMIVVEGITSDGIPVTGSVKYEVR